MDPARCSTPPWATARTSGRAIIIKNTSCGIHWALGLAEGDGKPFSNAYEVSEEEAKEGFKPLFNGVNLDGWALRRADGHPSWSVQNGMMVNTIGKDEHGTDIVTKEKFWNFTVRYEYLIPKGSNSGFYLRGCHEIQIFDDYGKNPKWVATEPFTA